ncbi:hypothetical protein RV18_GL001992 [Enterococcus termitis]|nr:hypothetical protein RV18_GL001992 [Enterococcus termitis]
MFMVPMFGSSFEHFFHMEETYSQIDTDNNKQKICWNFI